MTTWYPDTCACAIEYSDDGLLTQLAVLATCTKHSSVANANLLTTLFAHNSQKNTVIAWLVAKYSINITNGVPFVAMYNVNAPIANDPVIVTGLTKVAPTAVPIAQAAVNTQFGANAVSIVS